MKESEKMIILITGGEGQLGRELVRKLGGFHKVYSLGKSELDITSKEEVDTVIGQLKPDVIIHAAAFTAVDQCEIEIIKAFNVNAIGTAFVANAASRVGAKLFYISTDYVFDGQSNDKYSERHTPNPLSIYGMSKWMGEQFTLNLSNATVIRTSWLYGHEGKNFVRTLINLAKNNSEIRVVNDQLGSPTYVNDLAEFILKLLDKKNGIYHFSNRGICSWYDFGKAIFFEKGINHKLIKPISSNDYGSLAPRPKFSALGHTALLKEGFTPPRHWRDALKDFIREENYR
ncbi:dTDP-4-dehydrorhamnose reductase [Cytobacillus firmus]|uniref:dTDP-4-dehydrorhamnose reductase n=2 Tax=Cytobacillus TaxID=2675230 RepID=UPI00203DA67A|nr:dTDP-4-dehydrorhamnose reductase [Cytobacillus firmus]MCM3708095.1 dTDP-4-dehydrorhamnose reductase [Cytobacillus firmus]